MKKIISLSLYLCILTSCVLYSCGDKSTSDNLKDDMHAAGEQSADETGAADEREKISDGLPEADFGGYNFRIYTAPNFVENVAAYEEIGDVINDTIYRANKIVEERFNIKITALEGAAGDVDLVNEIKKTIQSGDEAFDISFAHDSLTGAAALEGYYINLYDVPNLDFAKPWWPEHTVSSLTFNDQMFMFSNSISTLGMDWTRIIYINKGLAKDFGLTVPYQDVFDGMWTLEKLIQMSKDVYIDANGNGSRDIDDTYGYGYGGAFYCSAEPLGIQTVKKDEDTLELSINNERTLKAVDLMYGLLFGSAGAYYDKDSYEGTAIDMFGQGSRLFIQGELGKARQKFRYSDVDYGILPFPKLDENQGNYYAGYTDRLFTVPTTAKNLERTGIIIEAMSAEGWKKIFPAYYEIAMKNKFLSDEESIQILDMIYTSRVLDFSYIYGIKFYMFLTDLFSNANPSTDFVSYYEKNEKSVVSALRKIEEKFLALKDN